MSGRIERRFADLRRQGRAGLVAFVCGGDPDLAASAAILEGLAGAGADLIEVGMPFSDPMADGPSIQAGNLRALKAGTTLAGVLGLVRDLRANDAETPVVLMGYYNPIHRYGVKRFLDEAVDAGVDGLIVVDLPPEEDDELALPALQHGLAFVRLATPTTDEARLPAVLKNAGGFLYYVSIAGITGAAAPLKAQVEAAVARLRRHTDLPLAVGFGIRTPDQAAEIAEIADAAVVGSALVDRVKQHLDDDGRAGPGLVEAVLAEVNRLATAVKGARPAAREATQATTQATGEAARTAPQDARA